MPYCPSCGAEVSAEARFCPSCGAGAHSTPAQQVAAAQVPQTDPQSSTQRRKRKRWPWILGGIILLIIVIAVASGGGNTPTKVGVADGANTGDEPSSKETFALGDIVRRGDFEAAALQANTNYTSPNEFERPEEGQKVVAVEFQLKNNSDRSEQISTILQFKLRDASNAQYDITFVGPNPRFPDGELAAGDTVRGWVPFAVPEDTSGFVFIFDAEVFFGGQIRWLLGA